ncbi:hypothetical protein KJ951_04335 [Patescibacteria group bacterium]|nr:hypothetical protein [Patescibacteria group bacterium]MBU1703606.1 hypothetical protein [Patescibacteria group bacterium]MBU1953563.1 hypothetical protein [Patescibacteria group bacterium]
MRQPFIKFIRSFYEKVFVKGSYFAVVIAVLLIVLFLASSFLGRYRQDMHGSVMVTSFDFGSAKEDVFADVLRNNPNSFAIAYLKGHGMIASGRDLFRPDEQANRAEFMKMLTDVLRVYPHKLSYGSCFSDTANEWFAAPICYAKVKGWVEGDEGAAFGVTESIMSGEALEIVSKAFGVNIGNLSYIDSAGAKGWLTGLTGGLEFDPDKAMTRGQVAELLFRALKTEFPLL